MIKIIKNSKISKILATIILSINTTFIESFLIKSLYVKAQPLQIEEVGEATSNLLKWFDKLLNQVNTIADEEDKRRLIVSLTLLNKKIYDLENDSRYLLTVLEKTYFTKSELQQAVDDTRESWRELNEELNNIGFAVRSLTGIGGPDIEIRSRQTLVARRQTLDSLDQLLEEEDMWIEFFKPQNRLFILQITLNLETGIDNLNTSSIALFEIVEKLNNNKKQ